MRNPDDFDAFYRATRDRMLLQTFALTGDLPAARSAVRDAYVRAWHHWRKLERQPDAEAWVRPLAWADAQRRHSARIWHRDKSLDADAKATLDALGKLTQQQRRVLLLNHLTTTDMPELAREVGIKQEAAERVLQSAASQYAVHRDSASTQINSELTGLATVTAGAQFPRASIIRRAGAARRRAFTGVGVGISLAALVGSGMFVTDHKGVSPNLSKEQVVGTAVERPKAEPARLEEGELLTSGQASRLDPKRTWLTGTTSPNTAGDGLYNPCQGSRFADPEGTQTLVRSFTSDTPQQDTAVSAVQATELSRNPRRAKDSYSATLGWYAGCTAPHTRLLATYRVGGVGDQASLFLLRTWGKKPSTLTVAVARTRQITTTTVRKAEGGGSPKLDQVANLLAAAVNRLCGTPGAGTCAGPPQLEETPPLAIGGTPGLLDAVDFPQAGSVNATWTGTEPRRATQNLATIACDSSDFSQVPVSNGMTRSFLMVKGHLPKRFGVTETVGTLPTSKAARRFLDAVRRHLGNCESKDLASTVTELSDKSDKQIEIAAWHVVTKVTDSESVDFLMAIVRRGNAVGQIGFVTAKSATFDRRTFLSLAARAVERMAYLPDPKKP
jgi:DNA-directed RNA polymerase specialized sigma24 family protein